ncbi:DUF6744 family protein [Viridibacillus sp. NPDC093762]|uniref:DUF6744 family protein n=1 Tax=Viridibacillus sp. NPDC093762 TaxID=3390720 RepID=UPI003D045718
MELLKNMTAVQNVQDADSLLGNLFWYSVGKQLINRKELEELVIDCGIDVAFMPKEIRSVDAFRRATKEAECKKATNVAGVYKNYIIREVYSDKDMIQRNIVVETVDQNGKRLDYDSQSGVVRLDKATKTLTTENQNDSVVLSMIQDINEKFHSYKDYHSAQHLRVMITAILKSMAPTPVRPNGGIYFVPISQRENLNNLIALCNGLKDSEGFKVAVVDSQENKNMINKKLIDQADEILEAAENGRDLRKSQLVELVKMANDTIEGYKNYREELFTNKDELEKKVLQAKAATERMLNDMRVK